jgi:hypothetical protein
VDADAREQRFGDRPWLVTERALPVDRGAHRIVGSREHRVHAVSSALHHDVARPPPVAQGAVERYKP